MRTIEWTTQFKRDFKRENKGRYRQVLDDESENGFFAIIERLANDKSLDVHYRDHPLSGNWQDHRDCHIKPDLVLIYQKPDLKTMRLVRLGSHSELGL